MKIMQINIWSGRIQRPLLNLVEAEQPDIIFAQEVLSYPHHIPESSPWSTWTTIDDMASRGKLGHRLFAPCSTWTMFGETLSYGNAILSKYPLESGSVHYPGGNGPRHFDEPTAPDHNGTRNFQHAVIETRGKKINLINHHGYWVNQPLGDETSVSQLQIVADYINKLTGPVIMAGDLNLSPESPAITQFLGSTGLIDAASRPGGTTLSGAHYVKRPITCDYVLTSPALKIGVTHVSETIVSDHRAVIVEIDA